MLKAQGGDKVSHELDKVEQSGNKMGTALKLGAVAAGAALVGLGAFAVKAVMDASDMAEAQNKVNVVFGDSAQAINEFASGAARNLGMSSSAALSAAGTFGNLFTSMGIGQEKASDMSQGVLSLAADLGSFNNIDPTEALDKLRAGLVGEAEPLRALGVNLNAAQIKAKAFELGFKEVNGELSASAKAQASYALILEQTRNAQGDFSNTSTGMANSMRIIQASLADATAEIGSRLLPAVQPLIAAFAAHLPAALDIAGQVFERLFGIIGPVATAIGGLIPVIASLVNFFKLTVEEGDYMNDHLSELPAVIQPFVEGLGMLVAKLEPFVKWIKLAYEEGDILNDFLTDLPQPIQAAVQAIVAFIQSLDPNLTTAINNISYFITGVVTVLKEFWVENWTTIQQVLEGVWKVIEGVIQIAWAIISGIITVGLAVLAGDWSGAWEGMKNMASGVWNGITQIFSGFWDVLSGLAGLGLAALATAFEDTFSGIKSFVEGIFQGIQDAVKGSINYLIDQINGFIEQYMAIREGLWEVTGITLPSIPYIPRLAQGGQVLKGGMALVGENGPELLRMPAGAIVAPLHSGGMGGGATGTVNVYVTVHGSVQTEHDLAESIRRQFALSVLRNGTIGY